MGTGLQYQIVKKFNCCLAALARGFHTFFNERSLKQSDFNQEILIDSSQTSCFLWWLYHGCEHMNQEMSLGVGGKLKSAVFFLPQGK